jgi:hypothetical protein
MITYTADKCFGLSYIGQKVHENKIEGRKIKASSTIIPTIHWTSFHDLSIVTGTIN